MHSSDPPQWRPTMDAYHPSLVAAADACAQFVADYIADNPPYWLTLSGPTGCGKTMMLEQVHRQIARVFADREPTSHSRAPRSFDAYGFTSRMRGGEYELPKELASASLLSFDDLGASRDTTGFVADSLCWLAEMRLGHWTMWTTNLDSSALVQRIDERFVSRLVRNGSRVITIAAGDYCARRNNGGRAK